MYFGHYIAPLVVFYIVLIFYPYIEKLLISSPSFAVIYISILLGILTNGTIERVVTVNIVRPLASIILFVLLFRLVSLFVPTMQSNKMVNNIC